MALLLKLVLSLLVARVGFEAVKVVHNGLRCHRGEFIATSEKLQLVGVVLEVDCLLLEVVIRQLWFVEKRKEVVETAKLRCSRFGLELSRPK